MKKFAILAILAISASSFAATVRLFDGYGSNAGEFDVRITNGTLPFVFNPTIQLKTANTSFATFCIEKDEFVSFNTPYTTTISPIAQQGGNNTNSGDAVSAQTGWLYRNFALKSLSGYNYSLVPNDAARVASANALQDAFWYLENEFSYTGTGFNYTPSIAHATGKVSAAALAFITLAFNNTSSGQTAATFGVYALNLWENGVAKQSQLILVPVPAAALLGLLGMGVVAIAKRRAN